MIDEVTEAGRQWVSVTARIFSQKTFTRFVVGVEEILGEGRDAQSVKAAVAKVFAGVNVTAWLDANLVALCVDGASVLLHALHKDIQQEAPNAIQWYCASHRTQRVDFDVTAVPKADRDDQEAQQVRATAKRLNSLLTKTARLFSVSMKRWAALRKVARDLGYHINQGQVPVGRKRLLKFKRVQKIRYIF
eukprot:EG_transcript_11733